MLTLTPKGRRSRDRVNRELASELAEALLLSPATGDPVARLLASMNLQPNRANLRDR